MIARAYGGRGVAFFSGSGDPTISGREGDVYLDVAAKRLWWFSSGSWAALGVLA